MKAIYFKKYGSPESLVLIEKPVPTPTSKQVLIKVKHSANNAMDWHLLRGLWLARVKLGFFVPKKKYRTLGGDISGEVVAIGTEVTQFKKGDHVFGDIFTGGYAEYAIAKTSEIAIKPENVSSEQAAAIPVAGMTALKALEIVGAKKGDHLLINGASAGVGSFTVQMAKHLGAKVTAVCSTKNTAFVKSLGADEVINYDRIDICETGNQYDHILDVIGNKTPKAMKRLLKPTGICANIGITSVSLLFRFMLSFSKQIKVVSVRVSPEVLEKLGTLLSEGHVKSFITARYPLSEVPSAIGKISTRRVFGKQIIENEK